MHLKNVFQRKENKYVLDYETYQALRARLVNFMQEDQYGLHTIISVYYDTDDFQLIRRSIDKPVYREKFRLRSYGVPTDESHVFMEIKKKVKGVVYKRRMGLKYQEAYHLKQDIPSLAQAPQNKQEQQIQQEINWLFIQKKLTPKVMIAYDRIALKEKTDIDSDFRITFDFNIRYRTEALDLRTGDFGEKVAPEIDVLMEVKALGAYPLWFATILSDLHLYKASFSKYAQTYQRYLFKEEFKHVI